MPMPRSLPVSAKMPVGLAITMERYLLIGVNKDGIIAPLESPTTKPLLFLQYSADNHYVQWTYTRRGARSQRCHWLSTMQIATNLKRWWFLRHDYEHEYMDQFDHLECARKFYIFVGPWEELVHHWMEKAVQEFSKWKVHA